MNINQEGARAPLCHTAGAPLPTRGRGCKRRSGVRPEPPWTPGAGGAYTRHSSRAALAQGWSPPPTGAQGRMRRDVFICFQGM